MALVDNLVEFWPLNEASGTRAGSLGAFNLTDNNTVGTSTGLVYPTAANFVTANSEYLSNTTFGFGGSIAIAAWFKANSLSGNVILVAKDTNTPASSRDFTLDWFTNTLRFYINGGGVGNNAEIAFTDTSGWHLVYADFDDSANTNRIRIDNGSYVTVTGVTVTRHNSSAEFRIGARPYAGFQGYFNGLIGPVGIWSEPVSDADQTTFWNSGAGLRFPFVSIAAMARGSNVVLGSHIE